jgi:hypothetical protein
MTITIKSNPDGVSGAIQVNGVDKVTIGASGIQSGVLITSYVNDAAAAAAGVPVGGLYHTAGTVKIRLT